MHDSGRYFEFALISTFQDEVRRNNSTICYRGLSTPFRRSGFAIERTSRIGLHKDDLTLENLGRFVPLLGWLMVVNYSSCGISSVFLAFCLVMVGAICDHELPSFVGTSGHFLNGKHLTLLSQIPKKP